VNLTLEGAQGSITSVGFPIPLHREPITNVTCGPQTPACYCPATAIDPHPAAGDPYRRTQCYDSAGAAGSRDVDDVVALHVDGPESFTYDVMVERPAFNDATQRLAHVGADFALFKAESITLEYQYQFYAGTTFQNRTFVKIDAPAGWDEAAPWTQTGAHQYVLPEGQTLPRGYVALGAFLASETRAVAGKDVHYVRLGNVTSYDAQLFGLIENATPYYTAVYGPGVHRNVLVVNAPDPMFRGGLGGADSFFVHESADIRTAAHEYAHVFQLFGTTESPPDSSIWLNEGDADYHSALAMYAADIWTPHQVDAFFGEAARDAKDPDLRTAVLTDAAYGTSLERFAYHKGLIVLRALDETLRSRSGAQVTLSDVLRALNAKHGDATRAEAAQSVTNAELQNVSEELVVSDLSNFFEDYVTGTKWPLPYAPFVPEGQLVVGTLDARPARVSANASLTISANVTNRGTEKLDKLVGLMMDGKQVASVNVSLGVGETTRVTFPILANATPGDHDARVLYVTTSYHTLSPPNVTIDHTAFVPTTVRANQSITLLVFLQNGGEEPGTARVEARANDTTLGKTTETIIDGGGASTLTLPLRFPSMGPVTVRLGLLTPQGNSTLAMDLNVLEADSDGDGVADSQDAFPQNPVLTQKGIVSAVQNTPMPLWVALASLGVTAGVMTRRP